jgi:hypothetical protein
LKRFTQASDIPLFCGKYAGVWQGKNPNPSAKSYFSLAIKLSPLLVSQSLVVFGDLVAWKVLLVRQCKCISHFRGFERSNFWNKAHNLSLASIDDKYDFDAPPIPIVNLNGILTPMRVAPQCLHCSLVFSFGLAQGSSVHK